MSDLCKDVRGKIPVTDLCEQELPKLLEKAKKKLEKTSRSCQNYWRKPRRNW